VDVLIAINRQLQVVVPKKAGMLNECTQA